MLEEWAALGLGAAIVPKSKLHSVKRGAYVLTDKKGKELTIDFEAVWLNAHQGSAHLRSFAEFLTKRQKEA